MIVALSWTVLALVFLLGSERAHARIGVWLAKPLASLGFVALALVGGALSSTFGQIMLVALVLCAAGDVLLIPMGRGLSFLAGLGCFALGHAAYAAAFGQRAVAPIPMGVAVLVMLAVGGATLAWLRPHLPAELRWPVRVYIAVISLMVALAAGASGASGDVRIAAGAAAFAASDLSVARDRFVKPGFGNLIWGLPLYYAAQLLLAWTAAAP